MPRLRKRSGTRSRRATAAPALMMIAIPIDRVQAAQIRALRTRQADLDEDTFWSIVLGDGVGLYEFQLYLEDLDAGRADPASDEEWLPDEPGPTQEWSVPIDRKVMDALRQLRTRRPGWSEAKFWQQALEWGVDLLRQIFDDEDGLVRPTCRDPDDEIPF